MHANSATMKPSDHDIEDQQLEITKRKLNDSLITEGERLVLIEDFSKNKTNISSISGKNAPKFLSTIRQLLSSIGIKSKNVNVRYSCNILMLYVFLLEILNSITPVSFRLLPEKISQRLSPFLELLKEIEEELYPAKYDDLSEAVAVLLKQLVQCSNKMRDKYTSIALTEKCKRLLDNFNKGCEALANQKNSIPLGS